MQLLLLPPFVSSLKICAWFLQRTVSLTVGCRGPQRSEPTECLIQLLLGAGFEMEKEKTCKCYLKISIKTHTHECSLMDEHVLALTVVWLVIFQTKMC